MVLGYKKPYTFRALGLRVLKLWALRISCLGIYPTPDLWPETPTIPEASMPVTCRKTGVTLGDLQDSKPISSPMSLEAL